MTKKARKILGALVVLVVLSTVITLWIGGCSGCGGGKIATDAPNSQNTAMQEQMAKTQAQMEALTKASEADRKARQDENAKLYKQIDDLKKQMQNQANMTTPREPVAHQPVATPPTNPVADATTLLNAVGNTDASDSSTLISVEHRTGRPAVIKEVADASSNKSAGSQKAEATAPTNSASDAANRDREEQMAELKKDIIELESRLAQDKEDLKNCQRRVRAATDDNVRWLAEHGVRINKEAIAKGMAKLADRKSELARLSSATKP